MRYFILKNENSLSVVGAPFETQPENSLPYEVNSFANPCFDKYPNPTQIVEGVNNEVIEVPQEVQLWRIRVILKLSQMEQVIETALNGLQEPTKTGALYIWNYGTTIERHSQTVQLLQYVLGLTDTQVDNIFIQANNIQL